MTTKNSTSLAAFLSFKSAFLSGGHCIWVRRGRPCGYEKLAPIIHSTFLLLCRGWKAKNYISQVPCSQGLVCKSVFPLYACVGGLEEGCEGETVFPACLLLLMANRCVVAGASSSGFRGQGPGGRGDDSAAFLTLFAAKGLCS